MNAVRCRGCGLIVGYTRVDGAPRGSIYHDLLCADIGHPDLHEERNDLMVLLIDGGLTRSEVALEFDVSRERVRQVASMRGREGAIIGSG